MIEYRVCWTASSNVSFEGSTDWKVASDYGDDRDEIADALSTGGISDGLELALSSSGFEWWVETREAEEGNDG